LRSQSNLSPCSVPPRSAVRDLAIICYYFRLVRVRQTDRVLRTKLHHSSFPFPSPSYNRLPRHPHSSQGEDTPRLFLCALLLLKPCPRFPTSLTPVRPSFGRRDQTEKDRERDSRSPTSLSTNDDLAPPCQRTRASGTQQYVFFHPVSIR